MLITGETGTGKELVARAIHDWSAQRDMPLVRVNCAALPETLIESELFGHVRGAFTGAVDEQEGPLRAGRRRHDLPRRDRRRSRRPVQAKLLRVLQEREFEPLGSERTVKVDVRVIAATNRDLRQLVGEGKFQEDLYYRLNVIPIAMPPLRERPRGHPAARRALRPAARERARASASTAIAPDAMAMLTRHAVARQRARAREHHRARGRARRRRRSSRPRDIVLMGAATRRPTGLPSLTLKQNLEWAERETVRRALEAARGVKKDAAEAMGISQRALQLLPREAPHRRCPDE